MSILAFALALLTWIPGDPKPAASGREPLPDLDSDVSALAPDGCRLAISAPPDQVLVLDLPSGEVVHTLAMQRSAARSISWRADGAELAVLERDGFVSSFGAARGELRRRLSTSPAIPVDGYGLRTAAYVADGSFLVAAVGTPAEVFRLDDGSCVARVAPEEGALVTALAVSTDGSRFALGDEHGNVGIWDARIARPTASTRVPRGPYGDGVQSLAFDPDGARLAIGTGDSVARLWRFTGDGALQEFSHRDDDVFGDMSIGDVAFSPDGSRLVTTSYAWWAVRVWDVASGRRLGTYEYGGGNPWPRTTRFTPDSKWLVAEFGGVVLRAETCEERFALDRPLPRHVWAAYRSAGGLAWACRPGKLRVCDVETGSPILERAFEER